MTVELPKPTIADRVLKAMGKKRGVAIPENTDQYAHYQAAKESFFTALFRPAGKDLPPGYADIFDLIE